MSDIDSLKLRFTDENPDRSSDDIETTSFHSTPHAPEPPAPPKRIASRHAPSLEPPTMTRLTMGLSRSTVTPHGAVALAATGIVAALLAASAWPVAPLFVLSVVLLALTAALGIEGFSGPVLADMERRFGIAVLERNGAKVRFSAGGREYEGRLAVYRRRASLLDAKGNVLELPVRNA